MFNEMTMMARVYERWMLEIHFLCCDFSSSLPSTSIGYLFDFHIVQFMCYSYSHFTINDSLALPFSLTTSPYRSFFPSYYMRARISQAITESTPTSVDWETLFSWWLLSHFSVSLAYTVSHLTLYICLYDCVFCMCVFVCVCSNHLFHCPERPTSLHI